MSKHGIMLFSHVSMILGQILMQYLEQDVLQGPFQPKLLYDSILLHPYCNLTGTDLHILVQSPYLD